MRKKLGLLYFLLINLVAFGFQMSPISFEKRIDQGRGFEEFYFPNNGTKAIRYKFDSLPGSAHRGDMSQWVELYPKILTIRPEEVGVLKVYVQSPEGTPEGEYGFFLDALPIEVLDKSEYVKDIQAASAVKIRAAIEMVGYVGDIQPELKLQSKYIYTKDRKLNIDMELRNLSDKRGAEITAVVKGFDGVLERKDVGRIGIKGELRSNIELDIIKENQLVGIDFVESSTNISILKVDLLKQKI